ncbi:flagellar export chaperone FliS [Acidipila rosea]|uniref:Flagellar protein FliS n=1 Tax=Acidipila rosea TaxID=768535 RepID=A0A4R1LEX6_9BACT|nr:flagellar export chaperone FliS [Acidipila rosea]MBW4027500.1 flagellar protein FliS [Acidobacteriota bacterium]TCK75403.1 flagellar protein FliS [Acidipila rosea]
MNYQNQAIAGMNRVELVVALYDGMMKFLHRALRAIDAGDDAARRVAIRRVLDILMHLQSRLRMDIGGSPAKSLSEFYAAVFALAIEGSRLKSRERLEEAINCVRNVREAWQQVARDPEVLRLLGETAPQQSVAGAVAAYAQPAVHGTSWTA